MRLEEPRTLENPEDNVIHFEWIVKQASKPMLTTGVRLRCALETSMGLKISTKTRHRNPIKPQRTAGDAPTIADGIRSGMRSADEQKYPHEKRKAAWSVRDDSGNIIVISKGENK